MLFYTRCLPRSTRHSQPQPSLLPASHKVVSVSPAADTGLSNARLSPGRGTPDRVIAWGQPNSNWDEEGGRVIGFTRDRSSS